MDSRVETRKLIRLLNKSGQFDTLNGFRNYFSKEDGNSLFFKSARTGNEQKITLNMIKKAIDFTFNKRSVTRKDMGHFTNMHSALLALLALVFKGVSSTGKLINGTLIIRLNGLRFFFGGLCRTETDMKILSNQGGKFAFLNYYNIRTQKGEQWLHRLKQFGLKAIIDSGAFSKHSDKINIYEYLEFINKYKDEPNVLGFVSLDKIGDPAQTKFNLQLMENTGVNVIPVWQISDSYESLDEMVAKGYDLICIGGTVPLVKQQKYSELRVIFDEVFKRHPSQPFHLLGTANPLMLEYPFFSCDATSWLRARWYGKKDIYLPNGDTVKTPHLSTEECIIQKINYLKGLEYKQEKVEQYGFTF